MSGRLVAVTGATGFLGRRLVGQLNAQGWRVRALTRDGAESSARKTTASDVVVGDLRDNAALSRLVADTDAVVHLAGLIKARSRAEFFAVNEDGTRNLALSAAGRRIVHVSSLAAREPSLSDYAASKRAGEEAIQEIGGRLVTIIRPPAIYGPGDRETLALFKAALGPIVIAPGQGHARIAVAEVDDVARDIVALLDAAPSSGMVTIGGERPRGYRWRDLIATAARAVGGRPFVVDAPSWLLNAAGLMSEIVGQWRSTPPIFTSGKAREVAHPDWSVSAAELGITAFHSYTRIDDGFAGAVAWYRAHGWLP